MIPKKGGKQRVCLDHRELRKDTRKDHFCLPFIDQVLDTLSRNSLFSFLDGFNGYNQIQIQPDDQDKMTFTCLQGTFVYQVLSFGLSNAPSIFKRVVLSIFTYFVHDSMEICMDYFIPYVKTFKEALNNLENVLKKCIEMSLCLSNEKCEMLMNQGIILGHHISPSRLKVDSSKVPIIINLPSPQKKM